MRPRNPAFTEPDRYDAWLAPDLDVARLARAFRAAGGILVVDDVLRPEIAERIQRFLEVEMPDDWWSVVTATESGSSLLRDTPENRPAIDEARRAEAARRLTHTRGPGPRIPPYTFKRTLDDHYDTCSCALCEFGGFLWSRPLLGFIEALFGRPWRPKEAFASKYTTGDHLDLHNDSADGREVAFVFGFSRGWEIGDGGVLVIRDQPGDRVFVPGFNRLVMFGVGGGGRDHHVTDVTAEEGRKRLSITGWFGP